MKFFCLILTISLLPVCLFSQTDTDGHFAPNITKIILVRHAEKADGNIQDPPLSDAGQIRAQKLNDFLSDTEIDALYATPFKRTTQTLKVIGKTQDIEIQNYDPFDNSFLKPLTSSGKTIVIAGHSNTIPEMVNSLINSEKYQTISESDYGKIWILTFIDNKLTDCSVYNY